MQGIRRRRSSEDEVSERRRPQLLLLLHYTKALEADSMRISSGSPQPSFLLL